MMLCGGGRRTAAGRTRGPNSQSGLYTKFQSERRPQNSLGIHLIIPQHSKISSNYESHKYNIIYLTPVLSTRHSP